MKLELEYQTPEEGLRKLAMMVHDLKKISVPADAVKCLEVFRNQSVENFVVITLDGAHSVINTHLITIGLVNRTIIHPREVFRVAILDNASGIILAHNHPSGITSPSREDIEVTQRMIKAGEVIGIAVLDHIIIGKDAYTSLAEEGTGLCFSPRSNS